jgi:hypothetical protein
LNGVAQAQDQARSSCQVPEPPQSQNHKFDHPVRSQTQWNWRRL